MKFSADTDLQATSFLLPEGAEIAADNITIDGHGATIVGSQRTGSGLRIHNRKNVTIRNLKLMEFKHGIDARNCEGLVFENVQVTSTQEVAHNTVFLNIFHSSSSYGSGILLENVSASVIRDCDLTHQFCGLMLYDCSGLTVENNNASYASGFGFYMSGTVKSDFRNNYADFCCRWHPRENITGHMGADAAGFVIVNGSSGNTFSENLARMGGDGFFPAGLSHDLTHAPCNDNLFIGNDASWSPNISFEATFSKGNRFIENKANHSNYGFWLGFSSENTIENNEIRNNRAAGIAVENGVNMQAVKNQIVGNGYGILLWSKRIPQFDQAVPDNDTSRDWLIHANEITANRVGIRIAADQDHGTRPFLEHGPTPEPKNHHLVDNRFSRNHHDILREGIKE